MNNYVKLLPKQITSPLFYNEKLMNLLKIEEYSFNYTKQRINILKENYNDLRRLIFGLPKEFKSKLIGKFLFSDFLWAKY